MERRAGRRTLISRRILLTLMAAALVSLQGGATTLKIASQNALHLSDSARGADKRATIKTQSATFDVYLVQETMKNITYAVVVPPGTFAYQVTQPKGASSYKERYFLIYNSALTPQNNNNRQMVDYGGTKRFARPPSGTMLKDTAGNLLWFVDFHAVFGKSVWERRGEAESMANVYTWFQNNSQSGVTTNRVVLAGDWNLGAGDQGFNTIKALNNGHMQILPNDKTSLTRAGEPSEPYDHFVTDNTKVILSQCVLVPVPGGHDVKWFRTKVSDHRGVQCVITY